MSNELNDNRPTCKLEKADKGNWMQKDYDYSLTISFNKGQNSAMTTIANTLKQDIKDGGLMIKGENVGILFHQKDTEAVRDTVDKLKKNKALNPASAERVLNELNKITNKANPSQRLDL